MRKKYMALIFILLFALIINVPIISHAEGDFVTTLPCDTADGFNSSLKEGVQNPKFTYTNPDTGYKAYYYDGAKLIDENSYDGIIDEMKKITKYGDVGFYTTDEFTETGGEKFYNKVQDKWFGEDSSTVFFIDMEDRYLWLHNYGYMEKCISKKMAETITDNAYREAKNGHYDDCAEMVFEQVYKVANGERIARPMKVICNILLSLLCSFFILFSLIKSSVRIPRTNMYEWRKYLKKDVSFTNIEYNFIKTRKIRSSSSGSSGNSGGGGGGHHGGGGGGHHGSGGGGHHGSGGGHHF